MKITAIIITLTFVVAMNHIMFSSKYWEVENTNRNVEGSKAEGRETYVPSKIEKYFLDNADQLGYDDPNDLPDGCAIWHDKESGIHDDLTKFRLDLENHTQAIESFEPIPDLLQSIISTGGYDVCSTARPHPQGLKALFPGDEETLSKTSSGYVEPLFSPMRVPEFCFVAHKKVLFHLRHLVHDFEAMCRKLKPHSRRIFIDLGASLNFAQSQPVVKLLDLYEKFGFNFDHIYAFESRFVRPEEVYKNLLPKKYFNSYHWINVGKKSPTGSFLGDLIKPLIRSIFFTNRR